MWHDNRVAGLRAIWRALTNPGPPAADAFGRDCRRTMQVIAATVIIAFPCALMSLALVFLWAAVRDHALLTASTCLVRVAEGAAVITWAAILRLWWRDRRRRGRG